MSTRTRRRVAALLSTVALAVGGFAVTGSAGVSASAIGCCSGH